MSNIRLPDPFTNSEAPGFKEAPLIDNDPMLIDELPNGRVLKVKSAAQFWGIRISYPDLLEMEYRLVHSAILQAKTLGKNMEIVLPQYLNFRVKGDTSATSIAAGQSGSTIEITGTELLKGRPFIGDLFKLKNHPKVYKIAGVDIQSSKWVLTLHPALFITTTGTEKPEFNDIKFQVTLVDKPMTENLNVDGMYSDVSYEFRENL